jgi:hypothetical protein
MSETCPYCSGDRVRPSGNLLGRIGRRLIGRPRFRCRACRAAWVRAPHGPVRAHPRRSILLRHPLGILAVVLLMLCVVFAILSLAGIVPGMLDTARKAKVIGGNSGRMYSVEGAVDRVHERNKQDEEKPAKQ